MEVEQAVIGCLLQDADLIDDLDISGEIFESKELGDLYDAMRKAHAKGETVNEVMMIAPENRSIIKECAMLAVLPAELPSYVGRLKSLYKIRRIKEIARREIDIEDVDKEMVNIISEIEALSEGESESITVRDAVEEYGPKLLHPEERRGIELGYEGLDKILGKIEGGEMCIVAARPSVGKSAFTTEVALNIAKKNNRVAIYSLEMANEQVYERMVAHESGIELNRIKRSLNRQEADMIQDGNKVLERIGERIVLRDDLRTMSEIYADIKRNDVDVAIIDYAQLLKPESKYSGNRTAEVGQISHSIKWAAKRLDIPIIVLAQLNRTSQNLKEPTMAELRESGDFEQDADKVILLWNKNEERTSKGVKVEKNRQGEIGKVEMTFDGAVMKFTESDGFVEAEQMEIPFDVEG